MASLYLLLRESSGNRLQLTSVSFAFKDPGLSADLKAFFRCPVQFDAEADSLNFPARFLELDIPTQDAGLRDLAADYLRMRRLKEPDLALGGYLHRPRKGPEFAGKHQLQK